MIPEIVRPLFRDLSVLFAARIKSSDLYLSKVRHVIDTRGNVSTFTKFRQLSKDKFDDTKEEFTALLQARII